MSLNLTDMSPGKQPRVLQWISDFIPAECQPTMQFVFDLSFIPWLQFIGGLELTGGAKMISYVSYVMLPTEQAWTQGVQLSDGSNALPPLSSVVAPALMINTHKLLARDNLDHIMTDQMRDMLKFSPADPVIAALHIIVGGKGMGEAIIELYSIIEDFGRGNYAVQTEQRPA